MPEHYTKSTLSASVWCNTCGKNTQHRIDGGRRGPCLVCLAALNEGTHSATPATEPGKDFQRELFDILVGDFLKGER